VAPGLVVIGRADAVFGPRLDRLGELDELVLALGNSGGDTWRAEANPFQGWV
jgi:hypothetical protein